MRPCFGNYLEDQCKDRHICNEEEGCFMKTSTDKGQCDCEFKAHCHIPRQSGQVYLQSIDPEYKKEDCDFYQMFLEDHKGRG